VDSDLLPLSRYTVDPDGAARVEQGLLERLLAERGTEVLLVHRGLVAVTPDRAALDLVSPDLLPSGQDTTGPVTLAYLGRDERAAYLVCVLSESAGDERDFAGVPVVEDALVEGRTWASLREVGGDLSDRDAGLASSAVALAAWHARHPRCPRCGEPTELDQAGWARRCPADGTVHYPRTDPAVIVAITDEQDRLLLAHAAHWPQGRFSLIAGYVEPGESLEAAIRREVAEESGLRVGGLAYEGSQPWPFPSSLMLGFRARAEGGRLQVDGTELAAAMFVSRSELAALVTSGDVLLPHRSSIARALIEQWFGGRMAGA
jgi:NAD+ diphosphatase